MEEKKQRYFTPEELAKFDGREGRPQYLTYKGKVYDISNSHLWKGGLHFGGVHTLEENLDETIKDAPHGEEVLTKFPIIGEVKPRPAIETVPTMSAARARIPLKVPTAEIERKEELGRRDFLKLVLTAGGAATLAALAASFKLLPALPQPTAPSQLAWPRLKVTNVKSLQLLVPQSFNYPLNSTPNILVKLGVKAENGVGPDQDVVAFSGICQHLGCFYAFQAPGSSPRCNASLKVTVAEGYCCCHGSQYDFVHSAKVISGPAPRPVPQVTLEYDTTTGDIYAAAMGPPTIFGHGPPGTTDPASVQKYDLQGGTVVGT